MKKTLSRLLSFFAGIVAVAVIVYPTAGFAVSPLNTNNYTINVKIHGSKQGQFKGDLLQKGREDRIGVYGVDYGLIKPIDPNSGLPTGRISNKPFTLVKELDGASPQLIQALVTYENLDKVEIFFEINPTNAPGMPFFKITLINAHVVNLNQKSDSTIVNPANTILNNQLVLENASFTYESIEFDDLIEKTATVIK